ncbi:MAG TPA: lipoyl synthase [Nitrospirae bacterium]|nr:lipoyl synthase [bacterium BMS3Abin06]HDH12236.1 lipoyl synthase [Nitrospirota bacterium]HDZ01112.1 lipoyl synthase [Nitrospirota bacterium]
MRHPEWIKVKSTDTHETKKILRHYGVSTVCEEARCPNQGKCFSESTATFMILGDRCTRNCSFCAVESSKPLPPDPEEPEKVAGAVMALGLKFVVITSVTRDDLPDGGAAQFAGTIQAIKSRNNAIKIEVLTPDFKGDSEALKRVLDAKPDVFNHNIETVPRLYSTVRPMADYATSVNILNTAKKLYPAIKTKSGIMVGLGETEQEVISVMHDLREADCDFLTIGQYLQPRRTNIPVVEYLKPEVFEQYRIKGLGKGFKAVASSPLTRSSMDASGMFDDAPVL